MMVSFMFLPATLTSICADLENTEFWKSKIMLTAFYQYIIFNRAFYFFF